MSYCRFSSMDFACDLYVYEASDGIAIHVAAGRREGVPKVDSELLNSGDFEKYYEQVQERMKHLDTVKRVCYTNREYAGESYYGLDHQSAIDFLHILKEAGYVFPDNVITDLEEELLEND